MHQYIERDVYRAAMMNLDAQSGLHVSPTIVEIYTAFMHMSGNPASESPVAGTYLRRDESRLV
jgi:hypothetical protein